MVNLQELRQFIGSERWFRHWLGGLVYTEGVHYLTENGAAWLVDAIASHQKGKLLKGELREFQLWTLEVNGSKAVLTCKADSDRKPAVTQKIEYTDFPEGKIELYLELGSVDGVNEHRVLMLTSER
jgi:hypothetical protein